MRLRLDDAHNLNTHSTESQDLNLHEACEGFISNCDR